MSDALALQLGAVGGRNGYGLGDQPLDLDGSRNLALVTISTCRDVAAGSTTWPRVISKDIADGATRGQAEAFNGFSRTSFCPVVKPDRRVTATPTPRATTTPSGQAGDGTRGLLSPITWLDARYKPVAYTRCDRLLGQPFGDPHSYQMTANQLLCTDVSNGPWHNHPIQVTVIFSQRATEGQALSAAKQLLPVDASLGSRRVGHNPSYASHTGSCISVQFSSFTLARAVHAQEPTWTTAQLADVVLYSSQQTDEGSADTFNGSVREAVLDIGGHNVDQHNRVTC